MRPRAADQQQADAGLGALAEQAAKQLPRALLEVAIDSGQQAGDRRTPRARRGSAGWPVLIGRVSLPSGMVSIRRSISATRRSRTHMCAPGSRVPSPCQPRFPGRAAHGARVLPVSQTRRRGRPGRRRAGPAGRRHRCSCRIRSCPAPRVRRGRQLERDGLGLLVAAEQQRVAGRTHPVCAGDVTDERVRGPGLDADLRQAVRLNPERDSTEGSGEPVRHRADVTDHLAREEPGEEHQRRAEAVPAPMAGMLTRPGTRCRGSTGSCSTSTISTDAHPTASSRSSSRTGTRGRTQRSPRQRPSSRARRGGRAERHPRRAVRGLGWSSPLIERSGVYLRRG